MDKKALVESRYKKKEIPKFSVGDIVKVYVKIIEEEKQRLQAFEGLVIAKRGSGISESFTVRRISYGEGVERTFPLHSSMVDKVEVVRRGTVKRAKLYYLRKKVGKKTEVKEKIGGVPETEESSEGVPASGEPIKDAPAADIPPA
jgi:large subunit ribosomal protein L19